MRSWSDYKKTMRTEIDVKDSKGHSALMLAAYNGHQETVKLLLDRGADPNSLDLSGNTILMGLLSKDTSRSLAC